MKRMILLLLALCCILTGCVKIPPTGPLGMPEYDKLESYSCNGWQDVTYYEKYHYHGIDAEFFNDNPHFTVVTQENMQELLQYVSIHENAVNSHSADNEVRQNYDFDKECISEGDNMRIRDREGDRIGQSFYEKYEDYEIYFFDMEGQILYYFSNNI